MYGLPGQTLDAWLKTLKTALSFAPEHLSCYQLTLAPETPMGRRWLPPGELNLPDEETQRQFFLLTANFLTARGYLHYEVANFAREETICLPPQPEVLDPDPLPGAGPGGPLLSGRAALVEFFVRGATIAPSLNAGEAPVAGSETLTPAQIRLETLYLGFRTREGVSLETIREQPRRRRHSG